MLQMLGFRILYKYNLNFVPEKGEVQINWNWKTLIHVKYNLKENLVFVYQIIYCFFFTWMINRN